MRIGFVAASLSACGHVGILAACARGTAGRLTATSNASDPRDDGTLRLLTGGSVGAQVPIGETFGLIGRVVGNVALGTQTIVLNGSDADDLPVVSAGFELGGWVRF